MNNIQTIIVKKFNKMEPTNPNNDLQISETTKLNKEENENKKYNTKAYLHNIEYLAVVLLVVIILACYLTSILISYWSCDFNSHYGLWNLCESSLNDTTTTICSIQTLQGIHTVYADVQLIDEIYLSKILLIFALCVYFVVFFMLIFTYIYTRIYNEHKKDLIFFIRNLSIIILFVMIIAFLMHLIGFFLFISLEKFSTSSFALITYFLLAIFTTNTVNFITIKYKSLNLV